MTSQNATTHSHTTTHMTHKIPLIIAALFTEIADITPELNKIPCRTELYKHTRCFRGHLPGEPGLSSSFHQFSIFNHSYPNHSHVTGRTPSFEAAERVAYKALWAVLCPLTLAAISRDFEAEVFYKLDALRTVEYYLHPLNFGLATARWRAMDRPAW